MALLAVVAITVADESEATRLSSSMNALRQPSELSVGAHFENGYRIRRYRIAHLTVGVIPHVT